MIRLLKAGQSLLIVLMLGVAAASGTVTLGAVAGWWKVDVVLSGSMEPTMPVGSLVFATEKPTEDLRVGNVLMFHAPIEGNPKIVHRIVKIGHDKDGTLTVQTKGDNNDTQDRWTARVTSPTSMVVRHHIAFLGYAVHRPAYLSIVIAGLVLLLTSLAFLQSAIESETAPEPEKAPRSDT